MNIQPVQLRPGQVIHATCKGCGQNISRAFDDRRVPPANHEFSNTRAILADLDGEPFKAYYHWQCVPSNPK